MKRTWIAVGSVATAVLCLPSIAFATDSLPASAFYPIVGVSLIGLGVAAVLLVEALGVRKIASGGAIAEKMSYVILAIICLAAAALTEWVVNFASGVTVAQAQLAREVLSIIAMGLLAAYFHSVRSAMQAYLRSASSSEPAETKSVQESESDRG